MDREMKKFTQINENIELLRFDLAFDKYIKNQICSGETIYEYYNGLIFENGYSYVSHGGGCSGEDCNTSLIISPDNQIISRVDW